MIAAYLRLQDGQLVPSSVTLDNPLPVQVGNSQPIAVVTHPTTPLVASVITADTTARDLLNSTNAESPTLDRCSRFRQIVWMGRKSGGADLNYQILGRATDLSGNPLGDGWYQVATGTISGAANSWFRVEITQGYWDQYRIQVTSTTSQTLFSKVVGVR